MSTESQSSSENIRKQMQNDLKCVFGMDSPVDRLEKLLFSEYMSDVFFEVGSDAEMMYAHKIILTLSSEVFFVQFNGNFAESSHDNVTAPIVIPDIEATTFREMLRFIYCGKANIDESNAIDLFYASHKYMLKALMEICEKFLKKYPNAEEVLETLDTSPKYSGTEMDQLCLRLIQDNPFLYFKNDLFESLSKRTIQLIAACETMNCKSDQLCEAIEVWREANNVADEFQIGLKDSQCRKLLFFGDIVRPYYNIPKQRGTCFNISVTQSLDIYGVGIFVGRIYSSVDGKISIAVKAGTSELTKEVEVKSEVYIEDFFFEKVTVMKARKCSIDVKIDTKNQFPDVYYFFLKTLDKFDDLGKVNVRLENCATHNCVAYILYSAESTKND